MLRVKGTTKALVATTDGNQAVGALDPWLGAALSVAEAARNVAITGARPLGVTNCLNYGDPTRPEAFWQLREGVRGVGDACRALGLPVTGGNVSLYNESPGGRDRARRPRSGSWGCSTTSRRSSGPPSSACDDVVLIGRARSSRASPARPMPGSPAPPPRTTCPRLDLAREAALQAFVREADRAWARRVGAGRFGRRARGRPRRVRDVGRARGAASTSPSLHSPAVDLFGESPSRLVLSCRPRYAAALDPARAPARPAGRDASGSVGGDRLVIELTGAGATGAAEDRGSRVADARRGAAPGPPSRLGARPRPRARLGGLTRCAACSGRSSRAASPTDAASIAALGLFALQHRGQESAGLAVSDGEQLMLYKDLGMISSVLDERRLPSLRGQLAIAHCRYSTTGSTIWENAQPTYRLGPRRALAIGHNGNLVNTRDLLEQLKGGRSRLPASTDTELLTALLADEPRPTPSRRSGASCRAFAAPTAWWCSTSGA